MQQRELYRQRSRGGQNGKTESKIAEQKNKDELQKGAVNTNSKHNTTDKGQHTVDLNSDKAYVRPVCRDLFNICASKDNPIVFWI